MSLFHHTALISRQMLKVSALTGLALVALLLPSAMAEDFDEPRVAYIDSILLADSSYLQVLTVVDTHKVKRFVRFPDGSSDGFDDALEEEAYTVGIRTTKLSSDMAASYVKLADDIYDKQKQLRNRAREVQKRIDKEKREHELPKDNTIIFIVGLALAFGGVGAKVATALVRKGRSESVE
ncbi:MAG: hypothetical protein OEV49_00240 [candidate division Zixibacteria bacterium]|nr:hypothetical protein [candidate division Zixibacteria bacterium]MDH3936507.1 hypothetical protein [candidate division Zixibacteria bacterium]MDH4032629.1 hypothetical protein [candidate division Zixibacteria bacterium]